MPTRFFLLQALLLQAAAAFAQTKQSGLPAYLSPGRQCRYLDTEYREKPKNGSANIICQLVGFDTHLANCWHELAEYYHNRVPEPGVKTQRIYFVSVPRGAPAIRSLMALKASPFRGRTFFVCIYDTAKGYSFINYPFATQKEGR